MSVEPGNSGCSNSSKDTGPHIPSCSRQPSNSYVIWPKGHIPHTAQETDPVNEVLTHFAQNGGAKVHTEHSTYFGICYWRATLSEAQAETLRSHEGVGGRPFSSVAVTALQGD